MPRLLPQGRRRVRPSSLSFLACTGDLLHWQ